MSIQTIMGTGLSALFANQQALKAVSTNVANVNTDGYSRLEVNFVSRQATGGLAGVDIEITRVANTYLAAAEMRGAADVSAADILAQFMDRAQGLLGDPSDSSSVFATLDPVFSSFGALAVDPASALRQSSALSDLQTLLTQIDTTAGEIAALRDEAHVRVVSAMEEANSLMSGIARLNASIQRATIGGVSSTEAETEQQRMLDRLAEIIDIRAQARPLGGVEVRTSDGLLLVDIDSATLGLSSTTNGEAYPGLVMLAPRSTTETPMESHLAGGELKGLMRARDRELVNLQLAFAEFAAGAADALNAAHNAGTSVPAPSILEGRNTGLVATDQLNFTGVTHIAIVDDEGLVVRNLRVDFTNMQIVDDQANITPFANSIGDFQTALNTALGADGQATFAGGQLTIEASVPGTGIAIRDDETSPALRAGKGFSHTFGLNDLVTHGSPLSYATGLSGSDLHGFTAGQTATFAMRNADGTIIRQVEFTVGAGTTISSLRADLDAALQGYAQTSLNAEGRLTIVPTNNSVARVDMLQDTTARGDTSLSMSQIFGFGETLPMQRSRLLSINGDISANPGRLATALADLSAPPPASARFRRATVAARLWSKPPAPRSAASLTPAGSPGR
ncbi:MAG: flagellar hook-associated protein FlgK [Hyphomonadaceae bacterium]